MVKITIRNTTLFIFCLLFFAINSRANDSDLVNCNRVWKIAVLGSSTSFGTGATVYDSSWVGKFTAYLKRKNIQNQVYNYGIPGYTTYQNLCPTGFVPPANRPAPNSSFNITAALAARPDALIINMPSNDAANNYTIAEQQANFERAVRLADSANVPVWVTTTQPRNNMTSAQISNLTLMRDWIFTRFENKAVDFWSTIANGDGSIAAFYDFDYVHVNNNGHDLFYKRMRAESILDTLCIRVTPTLAAKAGNDISVILPATSTTLNGSASFSSLGGTITSYLWAVVSKPLNSNPQIVSASSAITALNNLIEGRYSFSLTVRDNSSNIKTDTVDVMVSSRILIDFGPDVTAIPDASGKYWNTVSETKPGIKLSNAVTVGNIATGIGLEVVNRIDGTFNVAGPGTNTGNSLGVLNDYPASATNDFSFADPSAANGQWKLTGLEPAKQYTIKFWGTRTVSDDRIIQIKRNDQQIWQEYNASSNGNYNTGAIFTFSGKTEMSFDIKVKSGSAFGYICIVDITRTTPINALNIPPTARAGNITVSLPATSGVLDGTASSDDDGNITSYLWSQTSGPSVAQLVSPTSASTVVNNLVEGIYSFQLRVTDDSSAVALTSVTVTVNSRVLFDIGPDFTPAPDAGGKYWNNITNGLAGIKVSNAISTGNGLTGISFEIVNRIDGTFNTSGPGTNTGNTAGAVGDYPASATNDFAFAHPSALNGKWKVAGLLSSKQYTIKFWGTRSVSDERIIKIRRADETNYQAYNATNNSDYNNAAIFTFSGKTEMAFDILVDVNSAFGHISVVDISVTNATASCVPAVQITSSQATGGTCAGTMISFTAAPTSGGTNPVYQWRKNGTDITGATTSGYSTTSLTNNDVISCLMTSNASCAQGTSIISNNITAVILPIVPKAGNITGPVEICSFIGSGNNAVYSIAAITNATTYSWIVPAGASIVSGQGTTSIAVNYNNYQGISDTIKVLGGPCNNGDASTLIITKTLPATPGAISGPIDACPLINQSSNAAYSIIPVANATLYTWVVPTGASIVSGQGTTNIQVSYSGSFISGDITVTANSNCGSQTPRSLSIAKLVPSIPGSIAGPDNACQYIGTGTQVGYSISPVNYATSYLWTVPANVSLVSGQGTTSVTVSFNNGYTTSSLSVKAVSNCFSSGNNTLGITASAATTPGVITGPVNACGFIDSPEQATYTIQKVPNILSYIWTVPAGATITSHPGNPGVNDTIITVSFNSSFVSGTNISVQSSGCTISAARNLAVLKSGAPSTPGSIGGLINPCEIVGTGNSAFYTITKVANASSYNWVVPTGASATHPWGTGVNDTVIMVTYNSGFLSGTISVSALNSCGKSNARSLAIKVLAPSTTPTITGPTDPCPLIGTSGAVYKINKILNASGYTWTVPSTGATAQHPNGPGVNDTIIIVTFTSDFVSGNITARADANCGSSSTRSLSIVRKMPSTPGAISTVLLSACPNRQYRYSINSLPSNATSATWTVPAGASILSGQGTTAIIVNYPSQAISSTVTVAGTNNCGNSSSVRSLTVTLPACIASKPGIYAGKFEGFDNHNTIETLSEGLAVKIFPNPTFSEFRVIVSSNETNSLIFLKVMDTDNKLIETKTGILSGQSFAFGGNYLKGIYFGEFIQGKNRKVVKFIKL